MSVHLNGHSEHANHPAKRELLCPHITALKASYSWLLPARRRLAQFASSARGFSARAAAASRVATTPQSASKPPAVPCCAVCKDTMGRLHMCLQCAYVGCWKRKHFTQHYIAQPEHLFGWDLDHARLLCVACQDYVYNPELESFMRSNFDGTNRAGSKQKALSGLPLSTADFALMHTYAVPTRHCGGLRGLRNMGATCYLNVILQVMVHNTAFRNYFLGDNHNHKQCKRTRCVACELDKLFAQAYSGKTLPFAPSTLLHTLWQQRSEIAAAGQHDAHECLVHLLDELHKNVSGPDNDGFDVPCTCVVHQTFGGLLQSQVTCLSCSNVTTTHDPFLDISLDLKADDSGPAFKKRKTGVQTKTATSSSTGSTSSESTRNDYISLKECVQRFTRRETLDHGAYTCSKCQGTNKGAVKRLLFKRLPPVLSIQLKRFEVYQSNSIKIEVPILFPLRFDMSEFTVGHKSKSRSYGSNAMYRLFAVVNHKGQLNTGHYTAYIDSRGDWFRIDDDKIAKASEKDVLGCDAYMCFYSKKTA